MKAFLIPLSILALAACGKTEPPPPPPKPAIHNLTPDEVSRAQINAQAYFLGEFPAGVNAKGELVKKKGSWTACRPQDSNDNGLVSCTGMLPNMEGGFTPATMYCGYAGGVAAIAGCNDKDQRP